jgi:hypothetical protein
MPKEFIFKINDENQFQGQLLTSKCSANTKNGARCKRNCIIGYEYCYSHLESEKQLKIKDSTIPQAEKGLFAFNRKKAPNETIFKKDQVITEYNGENISPAQKTARYANKTAPYAVEVGRRVIDSALQRGVGSLANTKPNHNNASFSVSTRNNTPSAKVKATKPIKNNQEIFLSYGRSYKLHDPAVSFTTKNTR